jgi:hypothetical protein
VALNITVTNPKGTGFLTAYPDGGATPDASNVNYVKGHTVANSAVVPVAADGRIDISNGGAQASGTDVIVDVVGYYSDASGGAYVPIEPVRYLDTRTWGQGPLKNGYYIPAPIDATGGLDLLFISAYVLNATVTNTAGSGDLAVGPDPNPYSAYLNGSYTPATAPNTSVLNWTKGATVPNLVQAGTGENGIIDFFNLGSGGGNADLIVDVYGYYQFD